MLQCLLWSHFVIVGGETFLQYCVKLYASSPSVVIVTALSVDACQHFTAHSDRHVLNEEAKNTQYFFFFFRMNFLPVHVDDSSQFTYTSSVSWEDIWGFQGLNMLFSCVTCRMVGEQWQVCGVYIHSKAHCFWLGPTFTEICSHTNCCLVFPAVTRHWQYFFGTEFPTFPKYSKETPSLFFWKNEKTKMMSPDYICKSFIVVSPFGVFLLMLSSTVLCSGGITGNKCIIYFKLHSL